MQYVTSTERRGIKIGREQGRQEGLKTGIASVALRQLQRRIGALDEATQARVTALPLAQLEALSDALLDFSALSELIAWLQQHASLDLPTAGNGATQ